MQDAQQGWFSPRRRIIGGAAAIAIAACAWMAAGLVEDRAQAERSAASRTLNRAMITSQYARESLRRVELALGHTADEFMRGGARASPGELRHSLEAFVARGGLIHRMAILDRAGAPVLVAGSRPDIPDNLATLEVFTRQRDGENGKLVFGAPYRTPDGRTRLLPASMRLSAPDGTFAGVVLAEIDTAHFGEAFGSLGKEPGGFYTLFLRTGAIIARLPDEAAVVDRNWAQSPMFREHLPTASRKTVRQVVAASGIESVYSYDSLTDYPVITASGLSLTGVLEPWRAKVRRDMTLLAAGLLVLGLGTWLILRSLRSERSASAAQAESEERYRRLFDTATLPMFVHVEGILRMVNPATVQMFGVHGTEELIGRSGLEFIHPEDRETAAVRGRAAADRRVPQAAVRLRYLRADGAQIDVEVISEPFEFKGEPAVLTTAREVTQEVAARRRIARVNQLYAALSQINQAVVRATSYTALCEEVCRIAVEVGGMGCALVRRFDAQNGFLLPVAFHGPATGLIGRHELPLEGTTGVSVEAVNADGHCIVHDMATSPITVHAPGALEHGINSAAAFVLKADGKLIGTFAVFGPGNGFFDEEMVALLDKTAGSLAFAFSKIAAGEALLASERDLQRAQSGGRIGSVIIDLARGEWMLSQVGYEILGIAPGTWRPLADFVAMLAPDSRADAAARMRANVASGARSSEEYEIVRAADGKRAWIRVVTDTEFGADGTALRRLGTVQDITVERTARMAVAQSDQRFQLAIAASGVAIWDWDIRSGVSYLSDEYLRLFGYEPGEATGDLGLMLLLVHPEERKRTLKSLFRQWATGIAVTDYEQRFVCKDGSVKWVQIKADIVERDADGRALRMVGTASDLTARKAYEERILRLSRLYNAISKTNDAVIRQPDFAAVCTAACRIVVEEGGLVSATIREHDPATDTLVRVALFGPVGGNVGRAVIGVDDPVGVAPEAFRHGTPVLVPDLSASPLTSHAHADGAAQGIGATASFPLMEDGKPFGTFTVFAAHGGVLDEQTVKLLSEIADALAFAHAKFVSESARRDSDARMTAVISSAMDAIITCDQDMRIVLFNEAASVMFRCPVAEALGSPLDRFLPPRFRAGHAASMQAFGAGESTSRGMGRAGNVLALRKDGQEFPAEASISHTDVGGRKIYTVIMRDITQRLAADRRIDRLTRLYAALSSTNEAIVRGRDWNALCDEVCRIIVEQGGVVSAALRMPNAAGSVLEVVAGHGPRAGAIGERAIPIVDDGTSIAIPVFRSGKVAVVNDFATDPVASGWVADARPLNVNAAVVLPLRSGDAVVGVLSVYASEPGHFDGELAALMGDLADNLGFAHAKLANERAVAASEERFRALTMMASDWYWETDREHRFTRMSQGLQSDDGSFDAASVIGRRRWDFGPMVMDPKTMQAHRETLDRRAPFRDFEYRRIGPDGSLTIRCISGEPVFDEEGRFTGYRGVGRNVTRQRLAEEELRASEERYRTLVDASPDAIRVVCDGRIVIVNPACVRLWGARSQDEIIGRDPLEFIRPQNRDRATERLRRVIEEGAIASPIETGYVRPDGSSVDVETITLPFNFNGRPAALSIMRDLTERNTSQRALTEAERRYRSLVEASQGGVLLLAGDVVAYANPGMRAMLGFARQEDIPGTSLYSLILIESHEAVRLHLRRLSAHANQTMPQQEMRMRRRDGETIDVTATATSIDLDGRTMIQMELRDVTRERLAMAQVRALNETLEARIAERTLELTKSNSDLEAANRDLESFSYSVAHDLRAPLRSMAGFANLLEMDVATGAIDELPRHTARITQNAARMNALIDGLLAVSRVTHGELKDEAVDFARLAAEVIGEANPPAGARINVAPLPVMRGDTSALRQVWANLVSNALKYSAKRETPEVQIGVEMRQSEYVFHVRDNGAGFDPAYSQRLFGVFSRLHSANEFEGTGVGLAVVRRVIERHGGHVWAEGRPDQGATFYFTLPAARHIARPA